MISFRFSSWQIIKSGQARSCLTSCLIIALTLNMLSSSLISDICLYISRDLLTVNYLNCKNYMSAKKSKKDCKQVKTNHKNLLLFIYQHKNSLVLKGEKLWLVCFLTLIIIELCYYSLMINIPIH